MASVCCSPLVNRSVSAVVRGPAPFSGSRIAAAASAKGAVLDKVVDDIAPPVTNWSFDAWAAPTAGGRAMPRQEFISAPHQELVDTSGFDHKFDDYQSATRELRELEDLNNALLGELSNIDSLGSLQASQPAQLSPEDIAAKEARRAKRAAERAARKATSRPSQQPTPKAASQASKQQLAQDPAQFRPQSSAMSSSEPSTIDTPAPASSIDTQIAALATTKQRLEQLLDPDSLPSSSSAPVPPPSAAITTSGSRYPSTTTASTSVALTKTQQGPGTSSLQLTRQRSAQNQFLSSGPSLLQLNSSSSSDASSSAKERHARRSRLYNRQTAASAEGVVGSKALQQSTSGSDGTTQFMKNASKIELLDTNNEKELTAVVQDYLWLENVQKQLKSILKREPTPSECAKAIGMDLQPYLARVSVGQRAKTMMLQANYRLVISIAKKYLGKGMRMEDLISEGIQGLLKGVAKFDSSKGFRFSTYAHWWIRQAITRSLSEQGRTVKLPAHIHEMLVKITTAKKQLEAVNSKEPTTEEISQHIGVPVEKIKEVMTAAVQAKSLDAPVGDDDGGTTMKDTLEDERAGADGTLVDEMLSKDIEAILGELSEREAGVIRLRFGLGGAEEMTLEDIGAHFNVTRERIRQIEAKAVRKLKAKQEELRGILNDYATGSFEDVATAARSSRGTKKT